MKYDQGKDKEVRVNECDDSWWCNKVGSFILKVGSFLDRANARFD